MARNAPRLLADRRYAQAKTRLIRRSAAHLMKLSQKVVLSGIHINNSIADERTSHR